MSRPGPAHGLCFCGARWVTLKTAPSLSSAASSSAQPHMLQQSAWARAHEGRASQENKNWTCVNR